MYHYIIDYHELMASCRRYFDFMEGYVNDNDEWHEPPKSYA